MKRRSFMEHLAWTGAGVAYAITPGGIVQAATPRGPSFVQISDSHIGFTGAANADVAATLRATVDAINALPVAPSFVVHTGDVTHLSKPGEFAVAQGILSALKAPLITIPGEHDVIGTNGFASFKERFGRKDAAGGGWYAWDTGGAHFVALVNVYDGETMGRLGEPQLAWLRNNLAAVKPSTPVVAFVHAPLYALYPDWGWTTEDGMRALALLKPFDSATVLSGHIHQIVEHTEGNIRFATARATAYPQPAAGTAPRPGPKVVEPGALLGTLGYRTVSFDDGTPRWNDRALG